MSKNLNYKDFMEQVEIRLKAYSPDTMREMLMDWARSTKPAQRTEFLARLTTETSAPKASEPDEELLEEIDGLAGRVENGDYCQGWGWDDAIHEERDWGDESWVEEADELFDRAHEAMLAGYHELAKKAYARLFDILDMGEEPGHLPGSPDPQQMLDIDLAEARAGYLRSVYFSSPPPKRPAEMLHSMERFLYYIGDEFNLRSVINTGREPLPDFDQFLPKWIDLLKKMNQRQANYLLREAVGLSGGTSALARLAREEGYRYPRAYVDWIKALEKDGDFRSMLQAAKEGLTNIPVDLLVRAEIAEGMVRAGEHLQDIETQLAGWQQAFYSNPSLSYLLSLLSAAEQKSR
jgi:hypothetical protein